MDRTVGSISTISATSLQMIQPPPPDHWGLLKQKIQLSEAKENSLFKLVLQLKAEPGLARTAQNVAALVKLRDRLNAQLGYLIEEEEHAEAARRDAEAACPHPRRRERLARRHAAERARRRRHIAWFKEDAQKILAKKLASNDLLLVDGNDHRY